MLADCQLFHSKKLNAEHLNKGGEYVTLLTMVLSKLNAEHLN